MEFNSDFPDKLNQLDDQIENLLLDVINVAEIKFEDKKQFEQAKDFLKMKINKSLLELIPRMRIYEVSDRDING
jgi:hypothetical protein